MSDLISRQVLAMWNKYKPTIAVDAMEYDRKLKQLLGTNLAEVGTEKTKKRTVKGFPIDADMLMLKVEEEYGFRARDALYKIIRTMPKYELPEIVRCKECKHRPVINDAYDSDEWDCGLNIEFPDYRCPCQCEDAYYNWLPDEDWFCGNAERREE